MNIKSLTASFILIGIFSSGVAQKIKYKDLFVLLNAKRYAEAEPFLKKYLKENTDNPNAYLFMGFIYQDKSSHLDVLKDTRQLVSQIDSAVLFYDKAYKSITEKELNKNEEYYQVYSRRDLRTGKFGIKLSDVQLDLENRMKIKERATQILALKAHFVAAENYFLKAQKLFLEIQKAYPGQKELYLRADDPTIANLTRIANLYDSCHLSFNEYKAASQALGKTGYNQDLDPQEIKEFKVDGVTPVDFYHDDLKIWDYKRWALKGEETIVKEIKPMLEQLVAIDAEISKLQQKIKTDSASMPADIAAIRKKVQFPSLRAIDPSPLPLDVFGMRIADLEYGSQVSEDRPLRDSLNAALYVSGLQKEIRLARKTDSLAAVLVNKDMEAESANYRNFVTASYGTAEVLKNLIKTTKEFSAREIERKEREMKKRDAAMKWILDGQDSVPLFLEVSSSSRLKPLILHEMNYTAGLKYVDSVASGYFYPILPTRRPDGKAAFPVDNAAFRKRNLPFTKALTIQDEKGLVSFLMFYSEVKL
ncbi:MAG TPA: hypothetical protein VG737_17130, partial [Cyclobacteriaceae bacterium]|nr:hypothetical protein [Cyclobacteriaceae bacterium]